MRLSTCLVAGFVFAGLGCSKLPFCEVHPSRCGEELGEGESVGSDDWGSSGTSQGESSSDESGEGSDGGASDTDAESGAGASSETGPPPDPIVFADNPAEDYTRVDRMGMPGVNMALILSKDFYNATTPEDDANGVFLPELTAGLTAVHGILDDDLIDAGLVPCAVADCQAQAAPLVVPDTLKLDTNEPTGFPNGRELEASVMDVMLAVILLDLTVPGQEVSSLVGVLNPTANDVAFEAEFPYLAEPN